MWIWATDRISPGSDGQFQATTEPAQRSLIVERSDGGYFFRFAACVSADPATLLAALDDFGSLRIFEAFDATWGDVFSLVVRFGVVAITISFKPAFRAGWYYKLLSLHRAIGVGMAGSR